MRFKGWGNNSLILNNNLKSLYFAINRMQNENIIGNENGSVTMEDNSLKIHLPKNWGSPLKDIYPSDNSLYSLENLHLNVCNGFLHKQQKSEHTNVFDE